MNNSIYNFLQGSIIVLEGNIGVGKTTLMKNICNILKNNQIKVKCFEEGINMDYLDLFLLDENKYGFGFEMFNLSNRDCTFQKAVEFAKLEEYQS